MTDVHVEGEEQFRAFVMVFKIAVLRFEFERNRAPDHDEKVAIVMAKLDATHDEAKPILDAVEKRIALEDDITEHLKPLVETALEHAGLRMHR